MLRRRGFTLVELLVVIAIIGILISLGVYASSSLNVRGRNSTRKADLERIKNVLEQYNVDNRSYPKFDTRTAGIPLIFAAEWQLGDSTGCGHTNGLNPRVTPKYIDTVPGDPKKKFTSCGAGPLDQSGMYLYLSAGNTTPDSFPTAFALLATLETPSSAADFFDQTTIFGSVGRARFEYYKGQDFISEYSLDANYLVTGGR